MSAFLSVGTRLLRRHRPWALVGLGLMMATPALAAGSSAVDAAAPGATAKSDPETALQTLTDAKGQTVTAQVLGMVNTTVSLRRDDGQIIQVPLSSFAKSDQTAIVETLLKQFAARHPMILDLSAVTEKTNPVSTKIDGGTQLAWKENYRVVVKNQTLLTLDSLRARVILFKALRLPDVPGTGTSNLILLGQTHDLPAVPANGKIPVQTDQVSMEQILANNGGQFPTAPAVHAETDKLLAVWVRIYDSNDFLVQEWCSQPSLTKKQSWNDAWALATGQSNARGARGGRR